MNDVIGDGTRLREVHGHSLQINKCKTEKTKVREKVVIGLGFFRMWSGVESCQGYLHLNGFQLFDFVKGFLCCNIS